MYKIVFLGAGNVASHLSRHLHSAGHTISCVYARDPEGADQLARNLGCPGTSEQEEVPAHADFYIISVPDEAIPEIVLQFRDREGIWLHTSGAVSMDLFQGAFASFGVLYPLQTLSKQRPELPEDSPFLVEGSSPEVTERISSLASSLSTHVIEIESETRLRIHLAAVFANNFPNHLVHIAQQMLMEQGLDLHLLDPIVRETFQKIAEMGAAGAQTGPAIRGDRQTMLKHLELLKGHPEWEKLYTFISRDIERLKEK